LLVYRFDEGKLLPVVNASTTEKDWDWIMSHVADENITLTNASAIIVNRRRQRQLNFEKNDRHKLLDEIKYHSHGRQS